MLASAWQSERPTPAASAEVPIPRALDALPPDAFEPVRRAAMLRHCKWDAQVGDLATLAPFPIVLPRSAVRQLEAWSESLAAEALAAETELLADPAAWDTLAVPRQIKALLRRGRAEGFTPAACRVMRFDFHPTTEGWRVSEVNADVPGGFSEATEFTRAIAAHHPGLVPTGAPGEAWADAITSHAPARATGALLFAPGFVEDQQVVSYLAGLLRARGVSAVLAQPQQLAWRDGRAWLETSAHHGPLDFVVRFFQAEWLPKLPRGVAWQPLVVGGRTPVGNPGISVLLESKRFPLVWDRLRTPLPTWRALLPETRPMPFDAAGVSAEWMLKSAYSNNGDDVLHRELTPLAEWRKSTRWLAFGRGGWLTQRRFESRPIETPWGPMHVCLGVYVIDGRAAGMYGRLSRGPIVDFRAADVAVLTEPIAGETR